MPGRKRSKRLLSDSEYLIGTVESVAADRTSAGDPLSALTVETEIVLAAGTVQLDAGNQVMDVDVQTPGQDLFEVRHRIDR
jgi:hypothetical protein